MIVVYVLT